MSEHTLSNLLQHAARRVRDDGHFEVQAVLAGAAPRSIDVGPIADLLTAAANDIAPYEGRGWDEAKILTQVSQTHWAAVALARSIADPESARRP